MRWRGRERSDNVEDRRMSAGRKMSLGGGLGGIIIAIIFIILGGNPKQVLQLLDPGNSIVQTQPGQKTTQDDELTQFISVVLQDTEDVWNKIFKDSGRTYREPKLVLFRQSVRSACGFSSAATGPFYCPADEKVYIDLDFLEQMLRRFRSSGDFAMAYILAHEVGHHVQKLLGIMDKVDSQRGRVSQRKLNELTVRLELQADFLAGIWVHHAQKMKNILEEGDVEEALRAVNAVGDDRIQMKQQGYVVPDSFTHGTSAQRLKWFRKGMKTGDPNLGDTFSTNNL
ncbi:MAG: neutral zinc metallopeptidase [Candidatus Aminicenantes bacterium]|nr:neutral zinc metallopeptidase [Candidatus Aminicenantes bacterium]MCK5004625.1 neutral zinc metallopeptidase [Candidatus Aminicenantes bacterium]